MPELRRSVRRPGEGHRRDHCQPPTQRPCGPSMTGAVASLPHAHRGQSLRRNRGVVRGVSDIAVPQEVLNQAMSSGPPAADLVRRVCAVRRSQTCRSNGGRSAPAIVASRNSGARRGRVLRLQHRFCGFRIGRSASRWISKQVAAGNRRRFVTGA